MAERAPGEGVTRRKDGRDWLIGTAPDVAWIRENTSTGLTIGSAIPPVFEGYATIVVPTEEDRRGDEVHSLLRVVDRYSGGQPWWIGYLDTGGDDIVFDDALRVKLYAGWPYVLVLASRHEASQWREPGSGRGPGPDLIFPADRSWLVSRLWDDDWRCVGGPVELIEELAISGPQVRRVILEEDATPPGYTAL